MLDIFAQVQETDAFYKAAEKALRELDKLEVLVGIPDDNAGRSEGKGPVSNAELLFIHTNGSPIKKIPPRPVIEPSFNHHKGKIADALKAAADAALHGDITGVRPALEKAGMLGQNIARAWFTDPANGWKKNEDSTINGFKPKKSDKVVSDKVVVKSKGPKKSDKVVGKGKGSKKSDEVVFEGKGPKKNRPLIDTGEMRKSITYRVKRKG